MADVQLPIVKGNSNYRYSIQLDGKIFFLLFQFNKVLDKYTLGLFDENEDPIFTGRAIVLGVVNLFRGSDSRIPGDIVFVVDFTETNTELDFDTIGDSWQVVYVGAL